MTLGRDPADILAEMIAATRAAGDAAMDYFRAGEPTRASVSYKIGDSPVTEADFAADKILASLLAKAMPSAGLISEERVDDDARLDKRAVFIIDPIDGTRGFMRGDPRWAVCAALVVDGQPVLAALRLPALDLTFSAAKNGGAALNGAPIGVSSRTDLRGARIAGPGPIIKRLQAMGLDFEPAPKIPSLAYRIAQVARGELDVGLASTNACDWDIAAADLVLRESGGRLCDASGAEPRYNRLDLRHRALIAASSALIPPLAELVGAFDETA